MDRLRERWRGQRAGRDNHAGPVRRRQARNLYQRGEILAQAGATPEQRMRMYQEAQAKSQRVQQLAPEHPQGWFWEGTALGRIATTQGVLQSLFIADDIEALWLKTTEMKGYEYRSSNDAASFPGDVYFALGQFYRLCPDWTIVQMFIGTKGDIDESIRWHRKGVAFSPSRPEMSKELGVSLLCKANREGDAAAAAPLARDRRPRRRDAHGHPRR